MQNKKTIFMSVAASVLLGACSSAKDANEKNFKAAIQDYFSQNDACTQIFKRGDKLPTVQITSNKSDAELRGQAFDELVSNGFFTVEEVQIEKSELFSQNKIKIPAKNYTLTNKGKELVRVKKDSFWGKTNVFCYGKYEVVDIDNFTEPTSHPMLGATITDVKFTYKAKNIADWAKGDAFKRMYANVRKDINSQNEAIKDDTMLVLTNNGWLHEKLYEQ